MHKRCFKAGPRSQNTPSIEQRHTDALKSSRIRFRVHRACRKDCDAPHAMGSSRSMALISYVIVFKFLKALMLIS